MSSKLLSNTDFTRDEDRHERLPCVGGVFCGSISAQQAENQEHSRCMRQWGYPQKFLGVCCGFHVVCFRFVFISRTAADDGPERRRVPISPTATSLLCLWSLRTFPSLPDSHLRIFIAMQVQHSFTPGQPMVELNLLAFSGFIPLLIVLRKPRVMREKYPVKN